MKLMATGSLEGSKGARALQISDWRVYSFDNKPTDDWCSLLSISNLVS